MCEAGLCVVVIFWFEVRCIKHYEKLFGIILLATMANDQFRLCLNFSMHMMDIQLLGTVFIIS